MDGNDCKKRERGKHRAPPVKGGADNDVHRRSATERRWVSQGSARAPGKAVSSHGTALSASRHRHTGAHSLSLTTCRASSLALAGARPAASQLACSFCMLPS